MSPKGVSISFSACRLPGMKWLLCVCSLLPAIRCFAAPTTKPSIAEYQNYAMMHQGDAERGKSLFLDEQRLACSKCHTVDGKAALAGPDLMTIGDKFGRRELVESILAPSATIAVG